MAVRWTKQFLPDGTLPVEYSVSLARLPGGLLIAAPNSNLFSTTGLYGPELQSNLAESPLNPKVYFGGNTYDYKKFSFFGHTEYYLVMNWVFNIPIFPPATDPSFWCYLFLDIGKEDDTFDWEFLAIVESFANPLVYPPATTKLEFSFSPSAWSGATITQYLGKDAGIVQKRTFTHKVEIMDFADTSPDWPGINNFPGMKNRGFTKIRFLHDRQGIYRYGDMVVIDVGGGGGGGGHHSGPSKIIRGKGPISRIVLNPLR